MSKLQRLINKRNALVTQVRGELAVADGLEARKPSASEVMDRLEQLKSMAASFRSTQDEIEELQQNADAIASVHDVREEFFVMYYKAKDGFEAYLQGINDEIGSTASQRTVGEPSEWQDALRLLIETQRQLMLNQAAQAAQAAQNHHGGGQASNGLPHLNVRLPAISVPTFSGDRKQWSTFKDLYVSTIHSRADLAPSLKMQYLFSYLDGDAKRLVNKFTISSANYTLAWETLTTHYDKKRFTVFSLVREFMDQPTVTSVTPQSLSKLVTNSDEIVQQLDSLGDEFKSRDPWLIHLMLEKLDKETRASWSQKVIEIENPTFEQLLDFLKKRCEMLETCSAFTKKAAIEVKKDAVKTTANNEKKIKSLHSTTTNQKCAKCSMEHPIYQCEEFKKLSVEERREVVQKGRLCFNCMRQGHSVKQCSSKSTCHTPDCKQRHHTMLCLNAKKSDESSDKSEKEKSSTTSTSVVPEKEKKTEEKVIASLMAKMPEERIQTIALLPTAVVKVRKVNGGYLEAKALIDSGSQASLITEECVRKLGLQRRNGKLVVSGLGQQEVGTTRGIAKLYIASRFDDIVVIETDAFILGKLTSTIPSQRFDVTNLKLLENIKDLADPEFNRPSSIDIILGSDVFLALLEGGQVKDDSGLTVAQRTVFGWIVAGRYDAADTISSNHAIINLHTEMDVNRTLRQFWEQEEVVKAPSLTPSEQAVTEHFKSTVSRDNTGRFIVRLPFDDSKPALGDSLTAATKRMRSMEKRFELQPAFKRDYEAFIQEYLELGHMEEIPANQVDKPSSQCYYLPHHAVIKEASSSTKLRVVFDGSCGTSTGVSLNDRLLAGPNINADLFSVSLRFRSHKVVFCADVAKMYRQVLVHPEDRDYQRIVFREDPAQPFKHYRLRTVTYGTKTAPYLAIAAMREAATGYEAKYPQAVERIRSDFYVDDLLSGADNEQEARSLKEQIVEILSGAGFELRKWSSNNENLLAEQPNAEAPPVPVKLSEMCEAVKALGIQWFPSQDEYRFKVNLPPDSVNTKRQMISDSSKLFDPHGWLAPVLAKIKILYQNLWLFDIAWDDPLPSAIAAEWDDIKRNLHQLENVRIPRYLSPHKGRLQLHGFSDASEQAYAAVVYARAVDDEGTISVVLVAAKSRVAPIQQVSLPRLELNGGRWLAELMQRITEALPHLVIEPWAWTDSTILLHWLSAHPRKWQTYVANRTSFILELLPRSCWNHVVSKENPADLPSRGLAPAELVGNQLWFEGAPWLKKSQSEWKLCPAPTVEDNEALEARKVKSYVATSAQHRSNFSVELGLLQRRSSFKLIIRTLAWINRFIQNTKAAVANRHTDPDLNPSELDHARAQLARAIQHESFAADLDLLRSGKSLPTKSTLAALHPFLDAHGTMRVGGRLQNSGLTYDMKHPIILPQGHLATEMLVRELHLRDLHAGPRLLLATLYQQYWIIGSQTVVCKVVQACTRCVRLKARTVTQLMGNLPPSRVTATRPFSHTGVDYAGPIKLKALCVRGVKVDKGYIAVFVCLSSKAVHLEAASDLSAKTFLNVLKRFVARRGYPNEIHSDNGTNFVGADRIIREFIEQIESNSKEASRYFSNLGVKWIFNPPSAPHMGGLWEAAVKSVKKHLVAEIGDEALTFEDMSTILSQVEACLNSRPLCPLTSDPDSIDALTPGHFLIMQPLNLIPEPNIRHLPQNRLDHYQKLQAHTNNIWTRWKDEYLASLQSRGKWRTARPNVEVGQLVLVKNDNAPPTQWELARVDKVHPDATGIVRTVTLRRGAAIYQRPIHKLCLLPEN